MGLKKYIALDSGVIVTYHRIVSSNKVTNNSENIIWLRLWKSKKWILNISLHAVCLAKMVDWWKKEIFNNGWLSVF